MSASSGVGALRLDGEREVDFVEVVAGCARVEVDDGVLVRRGLRRGPGDSVPALNMKFWS